MPYRFRTQGQEILPFLNLLYLGTKQAHDQFGSGALGLSHLEIGWISNCQRGQRRLIS